MSVVAIAAVWKHSQQKGGALVVLLAVADYAQDDGTGAWPSVVRLAEKARMSERNARYALRALEASGELLPCGIHASGTTIYRLMLPDLCPCLKEDDGENLAPAEIAPRQPIAPTPGNGLPPGGAKYDIKGGQPIAPNPSEEPSVKPSEEPSEGRAPPAVATKRKKQATGLPEDWEDQQKWGDLYGWARQELGMSEQKVDFETDKFLDYWRGNGAAKVDWLATWRNWMRRSQEGFKRVTR